MAVLRGDCVLTLLRDDRPDIPWPNFWDLPGGGREGTELPFETAARELREELGITLPDTRVFYHVTQIGPKDLPVHFFAALWDALPVDQITLGSEGQDWRLMPVAEFLDRSDVIPHLQTRLRLALTQL